MGKNRKGTRDWQFQFSGEDLHAVLQQEQVGNLTLALSRSWTYLSEGQSSVTVGDPLEFGAVGPQLSYVGSQVRQGF